MNYKAIADKVLNMLQHADGNDPSRGHLTMNNWEWPTGVALYGIYKTYQQSGDKSILDYLTDWYDDMLAREEKPHRNVNTVAPVLALTCLYDETHNPSYLPVIESWAQWVLEEMPRTEFGGMQHCTVWNKHYQQLWCDTLFMVSGTFDHIHQGELSMLSRLISGNYRIERRMMLDVSVIRDDRTLYRDLALNDAVITKGAVARIVDLAVYGDGVLISDFGGDGVIVSTPTGSTAYSMSAGGPIVEPTAESIVITPICAHALQAKSFVLGRDRTVEVRTEKYNRKSVYLSVDGGRAFKLFGGDRVMISRSESTVGLVRLTEKSFYSIMSEKLGKG